MTAFPIGCLKTHNHIAKLANFPLVKTWRSPFQKAAGDEEYQWLHEIADDAAPEIARRFVDAVRRIRGTVKEAELQAALQSGDVDAVMEVLGVDADIQAVLSAQLTPPLSQVVGAAGTAALDATPPLAAQGGALTMRFDMVNPYTVQAVRTQGFTLIQQITEDTRAGIRQIVADAMEFGGHPYEQARQIRSLIGLTENQANAVANFRRMLETRDRDALTRALRDRRFDPTLTRALGADPTVELAPEQIDNMVGRYAARMLDYRAKTIARNETLTFANLGTTESWRQSVDAGLLDRATLRRGFLVTPDDRLCIYCAATPLLNPEGVGLDEDFQTPLGPFRNPPIHVQCRCIPYLIAF